MAEQGKFFFIRSQLNDLVLEVKDGMASAGQPVVTGRSHGGDNQLWYEDTINECIRSKLDDWLVLELQGEELVLGQFEPDESQQRWKCQSNKIVHCEDEDQVLDIADNCEDDGARVCSFEYNGGNNQLWNFENIPPQYCYIVSRMHGRVLDVRDGSMDPGTKVVMMSKTELQEDNQLWYEDKYGYIHSKLNGFVFDSSEGSVRLQPYDPTLDSRKWIKNGHKIINKADPDTVLDIKGAKSGKGAKLIAYEYKAADNQHWAFEYV